MSAEFLVCTRRQCGWRGTRAQQLPVKEGPGMHVLTCPECGNVTFYKETPLFVPLKREHFEAFKIGEKNEEFRPLGDRWNRSTCHIGREVVLSLGYGKKTRLRGVISSFRVEMKPVKNCTGWRDIYGSSPALAACIGITINREA